MGGEASGAKEPQRNRPVDRPLKVIVSYVVVTGPDGEALRRRQNAAIREAVLWLAAHQPDLEPTKEQTPPSGELVPGSECPTGHEPTHIDTSALTCENT
ncbi:hypothetical protein ABH941_004086 [Streptacidiphilus sp. EB103A]